MKPMLKPPGTKHLKLTCDTLLSTFAVKFYLRRYTQVRMRALQLAGRAWPSIKMRYQVT